MAGFFANETVTITYGGTTIATVTTGSSGAFAITFVASAPAHGDGNVFVQATDSSGRFSPYTFFMITPTFTITPTSGTSGTTITLQGKYFWAINNTLYWYDPSTKTLSNLGSVAISSSGSFTMTITAPANLKSGHTYYLQIVYVTGPLAAQAKFVA